ncbi:MAG: DUF2510 domain-containing protein [Thermoleophilia bacterium]|nr:DUF2510 domain-containing protein [Thermoleophilia bacterium]
MSTPAGWYDDPTRGGRLRYWDGSQWTEWVSENGQTASEPLGAPHAPASGTPSQVREVPAEVSTASERAAEPTPGSQPAPGAGGTWGTAAPAAVAVSTGTRGGYPMNLLGRVGHGIAAVGGLFTLGSIGQTLTEQPLGNGYEATDAVPVTGLVLTAGAVVAALVPNVWARLGGHLVAAGAAMFLLLFMIGTRTGDALVAGTDVSVSFGWWCIAIAAGLGVLGVLMATFFFTTPARADDGRDSAPPMGVIGFVVALVGVLVFPLAAVGGAAGLLGKHDSDASSRRIGGRGLAIAAFWVGVAAFALWGVILWIAGVAAQP